MPRAPATSRWSIGCVAEYVSKVALTPVILSEAKDLLSLVHGICVLCVPVSDFASCSLDCHPAMKESSRLGVVGYQCVKEWGYLAEKPLLLIVSVLSRSQNEME